MTELTRRTLLTGTAAAAAAAAAPLAWPLWRGAVAFPPARGRARTLDVGRCAVYSGRP